MARHEDGSTDTLESDIEHVCQPAAPQATQLWYKKLVTHYNSDSRLELQTFAIEDIGYQMTPTNVMQR